MERLKKAEAEAFAAIGKVIFSHRGHREHKEL